MLCKINRRIFKIGYTCPEEEANYVIFVPKPPSSTVIARGINTVSVNKFVIIILGYRGVYLDTDVDKYSRTSKLQFSTGTPISYFSHVECSVLQNL